MGCGVSSPVVPTKVNETDISETLSCNSSFIESLCRLSVKSADGKWIRLADMSIQEVVSKFIEPLTATANRSFGSCLVTNQLDWNALELQDQDGEPIRDAKQAYSTWVESSRLQLLTQELESGLRPKKDARPIPLFFVSHPWSLTLSHVGRMLVDHTAHQPRKLAFYWFDILAVNFHDRARAVWNPNIVRLMHSISGFLLLVSPWENPECFKRLWCLFEAWYAKKGNVPVHFAVDPSVRKRLSSSGALTEFQSQGLSQFSVANAIASNSDEEKFLLGHMLSTSDVTSVNTLLIETFKSSCKLLTLLYSTEIEPAMSEFVTASDISATARDEPSSQSAIVEGRSIVASDGRVARSLAFGLVDSHCAVERLQLAFSESDCVNFKGAILEIFSALKSNSSITELHISMPLLQHEPLTALLAVLANSRVLRAVTFSCWLDDDKLQRICAALAGAPVLRWLRLANNGLGAKSAHSIANLLTSGRSRVQELQVLQHELYDEGLQTLIPSLTAGGGLQALQLYSGSMSDSTSLALAEALKGASHLSSLSFNSEGIRRAWISEAASAAFLSALQPPPNADALVAPALTTLDLAYVGLTPTGAALTALIALVRSNARRTLVRLFLQGNDSLGDKGAAVFAFAVAKNEHLEEINLGSCGLGSDAVSALADAISVNGVLQRLVLDNNIGIIEHDARSLLLPAVTGSASIKHISLTGTRVSQYAVNLINAAIKGNKRKR